LDESAGTRVGGVGSVWELTQQLCVALVAEIGGVGCIVSRVIGDVLVQVAEYAPDGRTFQLGRGYLVSQFPTTGAVLESGLPQAVTAGDADADAAEVAVLTDLSIDAVLMLALYGARGPWGLVELYRDGRPFDDEEAERAQQIVDRASETLIPLVAR
jgi:hypothetical protein